ncbi:hypothetical protein [Dietzia sp. MNB45]|uniref:hypothetical protein n=1 Tax=Dietzia sp. MNB45 TaxID=3238800 RepID=UPI003F7E424D
MTAPDGRIPDGAYVGQVGQGNSLTDLNNLDESEAKRRMQTPVDGAFNRQRDGQWGLIDDLIDMMNNRYTGTVPTFIDGQLDLTDRFDLLGTSAYCAAYMYNNLRLGPGRNRALPFDSQIGPNNDAELVQVSRPHPEATNPSTVLSEWCIRLDRAGLWHANASFVHAGDGFDRAQGEIVVLKPDLTPYSYTTLPAPRAHADGGTASDVNVGVPVSLSKFFVTPDPGYYVQVRWKFNVLIGIRTVKGGARLSQFSVVQWSDDIANTDTSDDPGGTIDDTA